MFAICWPRLSAGSHVTCVRLRCCYLYMALIEPQDTSWTGAAQASQVV